MPIWILVKVPDSVFISDFEIPAVCVVLGGRHKPSPTAPNKPREEQAWGNAGRRA